jgi:hypothetical protein
MNGTCVAVRSYMYTATKTGIVGFVITLSLACGGAAEESRTVTNTDTTTTGRAGTTQTTTQDTQVVSTDGSKDTTHVEEVKQQPAK